MQLTYPAQVNWTLDENHFLVQAWLNMSEDDKQAMLDTLINEMVTHVNDGGSFAAFTIDRIEGDNQCS